MDYPPYIIIQASGRGKRLNHQTNNKPKALISFLGQPIIIKTMNIYKNYFFIILGCYQFKVLKKYLKKYSPTKNYRLIKTKSYQSESITGIKQALKFVPKETPFMIFWCDLYHFKSINFQRLKISENNYLGLFNNSFCRWRFKKGILEEKRSKNFGVAGVFIFKDKEQLKDLYQEGEFCQYLKDKKIKFKSFFLENIIEIGTVKKYYQLIKRYPVFRPFNHIKEEKNQIIKIPINPQSKKLANLEINWYKEFTSFNFKFLPKIFNFNPLTLEKIPAKPLFLYSLSQKEKEIVLKKIINSLKIIHSSFPPKKNDFYQNNYLAYLEKTKKRLDSVADLIPLIDKKYLIINNKKCLNFYLQWQKLEKETVKYFSNIYVPIHGDCTFSNILYEPNHKEVYFIDPRGYFGKELIYGDCDYDWAKIFYSLYGDYDQFNAKNFILKIEKKNIFLKIKSNGYKKFVPLFFRLTDADFKKIFLLHGIIWLSLSSYCFDDYDALCGAFYRGIFLLNSYFEKYG